MADESTQSIVVDAPPQDVMAVIADFPAYPEWANAVKSTDSQFGADFDTFGKDCEALE